MTLGLAGLAEAMQGADRVIGQIADKPDFPARQLALGVIDYQEAKRWAERMKDQGARSRALKRVERQRDLLEKDPVSEDLTFNHSGLCQTSLPHTRLPRNVSVWQRQSGIFTLTVTPGRVSGPLLDLVTRNKDDPSEPDFVGVPFGPKARLIMFHLQSEGLRSRTVSLGKNLSAFLRSLGLEVTGGPRGTIKSIKEQALRIGRCTYTMQWASPDGKATIIKDTKIADGMALWNIATVKGAVNNWEAEVCLSQQFHDHLKHHAVPLDRRGISMLTHNSLGLDLYALLAYRLPNLNKPVRLTWRQLAGQLGSDDTEVFEFARRVRDILPLVVSAYPDAKIEVEVQKGRALGAFIMKPSRFAVPKTVVQARALPRASHHLLSVASR